MEATTRRRLSPGQARGLIVAGVGLSAIAFSLGLYAVPSEIPGIPSFPFFSLPFPLLSGLLVISAIFLSSGWISFPGLSIRQLLKLAGSLIVLGISLRVVSFVAAIPVDLGGGFTVLLEPYAAHTTMILAIGAFLGLFGALFWAVYRREQRREGMTARGGPPLD